MAVTYKGIQHLREKLKKKRLRVLLRYKYYEMKERNVDPGIVIPVALKEQYRAILGWCTKSVDSIADRLIFRDFENDTFEMNEIYNMNNPDTIFDSAILSALIGSCSFIYISEGDNGFPKMQVIDGGNATGIIDSTTNMLTEGYAVLERDSSDYPLTEAYFIAGKTMYFRKGKLYMTTENKAPYALLVPIIYRPDARRPFGRSRISRAGMYHQRYGKRTLERSEISAEFYSFPQKYITGTSQNVDSIDKWKATISTLLEFSVDEDGNKPTLGQFQQQSMTPYTEQLKTAVSGFAGETGLTVDDLGFVSDNPSSSEAIKASHEVLRSYARKAQKTFGAGFINAGYLAACLRDNETYERNVIASTKAKWEPLFEPDAATLSSVGDGAIKINTAVPGFFNAQSLRDLTGLVGGQQTSTSTATQGEIIDILEE